MAEKPRVKAPKKRDAQKAGSGSSSDRRLLFSAGGIIAVALVVAAGGFFLLSGGSAPSATGVRTDLEAAGCTLLAVKALEGHAHADSGRQRRTGTPTLRPAGPTSASTRTDHVGTIIWGAYTEPVQLARVLHNLEHGGIYIFYGEQGLGGRGRRAPVVLREPQDRNRPRAVPEAEGQDRPRRVGLRRGQGHRVPREVPDVRRARVRGVLQRVPVQGPRALLRELAPPRRQLASTSS